jgi:hypothetical protein
MSLHPSPAAVHPSPASSASADFPGAPAGCSGDGLLSPLNSAEASALNHCERRIHEGLGRFRDVGLALASIRDNRLYRATDATFEIYCRERWQWSRQRAHQMIECAEVAASLPGDCQPLVDNERQARELAKVEPEKRAEVLAKAAQAGPVTAKAIKQAAQDAEPEPVVREDSETRAYRVSLKIKALTGAVKETLASLNPTHGELVQAACAFRKLANDLDKAAQLLGDETEDSQ